MINSELQTLISGWFDDLTIVFEGKQYLTITIPKEKLRDLILKLKNEEDTSFDYLFCLTGVDNMPSHLSVYYHLESTKHRHIIALVTKTEDRENVDIDTVSDIYPTAIFHEREAYDLLGINFVGHPDLRRLFMTEDWVGYPLRKDYVDEANLIFR